MTAFVGTYLARVWNARGSHERKRALDVEGAQHRGKSLLTALHRAAD